MRLFPRRAREVGGFDMTPMIDVVMQLIIFFMYTSQFAHMARTPIDLPEQPGDQHKVSAPTTVTVDVNTRGGLAVEGSAVTLAELRGIIASEIDNAGGRPGAVTVRIRADQGIDSRPINRIATTLADLGVHGWKLGTVEPRGGGTP